eukprot:6414980-Amphidinium_carterae.1
MQCVSTASCKQGAMEGKCYKCQKMPSYQLNCTWVRLGHSTLMRAPWARLLQLLPTSQHDLLTDKMTFAARFVAIVWSAQQGSHMRRPATILSSKPIPRPL